MYRFGMYGGLMLLCLIACTTSMSFGQEEPKAAKKKKSGAVSFAANFIVELEKKIESAEPTDDQKSKFKSLSDEYAPKFAELTKKFEEGMPADVRKQLASARKELVASGAKRKELAADLAGKVSLTEEQKKLHEETNAAREKLQREILTKVTEILTPEQLAKTGIKPPKTKKRDKKSET
jgi:hypothetical protein